MPNGNDRDWVRFCAAIDGFRSQFGRWPVRVRLFPDALLDIRDHILTPEGFAQVESRVELVPDDDASMIAEDDSGARYNYGQSGFPETPPDTSAMEWFGNPGLRPEAAEDGFVAAIELASKPNYLGAPEVVSKAVGEYISAVINMLAKRISYGECDKQNTKVSRIFSGEDPDFTIMPGWHTADMLGKTIVRYFDMDAAYFEGECLIGIVSEGLAAVSLKIREFLDAFQGDNAAEWERDAVPQLTELHRFLASVMMGTNEVYYPGKHLKDFTWRASAE